MKVLWNGGLVDAAERGVSFGDRAFLLGDGLFETARVSNGSIEHWELHFDRLRSGAAFLRLRLPDGIAELSQSVGTLLEVNQLKDAALRLTVSRGVGVRGYSPRGADRPSWLVALSPLPERAPGPVRLAVSPYRVFSGDPLLRYKTTSRALNVVAKAEAEARGADDAVFINERGELTETTSANLFLYIRDEWRTAPMEAGLLPGTTRRLVMDRLVQMGERVEERAALLDELADVSAAMVTSSVVGPIQVSHIEDNALGAWTLEEPLILADSQGLSP